MEVKAYLESLPGLEIIAKLPDEWVDSYDVLGIRQAPEWLTKFKPDWLILAWWPNVIHSTVIACAQHTLNIHNSFLPWCRGKHPNFWSIVEGVPYGVTLHEVTPVLDGGGIYAQQSIPVTWEDTGETLHRKSLALASDLFMRSWEGISSGRIKPVPQNLAAGSYHDSKELEPYSRIPLNVTTGREVLNIIRARQAYGHTASFMDAGQIYDVKIEITARKPAGGQ